MTSLVLAGGSVLTARGVTVADVAISNGRVAAVARDLARSGATVIDATGCWIGPGFVDVHTHLREPGFEHKEDIASGSRAAAAGGYTAVVAMPNTDPATDNAAAAHWIAARSIEVGLVDVQPAGTVTVGRAGRILAPFEELWEAGVRIFTDDGDTVADPDLLRSAMERVAALGGVLSQHAVDPALAAGGHMHRGTVSKRLGIPGIPSAADDVIVERDLDLVRATNCRYHLQHASTASSVEAIRRANDEGLPVTAEVTPHHLAFDQRDVATLDTSFKMMPPLRAERDRESLRLGLRDGTVDMVATDHAPHAPEEKNVEFTQAPNGVTGLEWAAAVVTTTAGLGIEDFFDRMATAPARLAALDDRHGGPVTVGRPANLVVFDPNTEYVARHTVSKSTNSPYLGRRWRGVVKATIFRGEPSYTAEGER